MCRSRPRGPRLKAHLTEYYKQLSEERKMEKKTTGLTLAKADASGKKYKRAHWTKYTRFTQGYIPVNDAIATDWELEPEAKLLTREDVERAVCWLGPTTTQQILKHLFGEESEG